MELRTCTWCRTDFAPKERGHNARYCDSKCKARARRSRGIPNAPAQRKRHYDRVKLNPIQLAEHRLQARTHRQKVRAWLALYKLERGCADCGFKGHFAALQLDHTGEKRVEIADARSSIRRLREEIEAGKCVVRCANCHAIKTWRDKQPKET